MFRRLLALAGAVLMVMLADPAPAKAPEPELAVLPNGLQVLVQQDERFPLIAVRLYVRAGSAMEDPDKAGISHLLEHMVFKSNGKAENAAERIEAVGGNINAATSFDYTMYILDLPDEHLGLGLSVLRDMIFDISIDPNELEREKKVVLSELERGEDTPGSLLFKKSQGLVWKGTGYERPVIGMRETLAKATAEDMREHIARLYQPQSMLLVVCGKVSKEAVLEEAARYFGKLRNDRTLRPLRAAPKGADGPGPMLDVIPGPWNKAYVSYAFPLPGLKSEDSTPLEVLGYMLGGDETSLLYRRFKYELGIVDEISASAMSLDRAGVLYVMAILDTDKIGAFWPEINKTMSGITAATFDREALDRAVTNIEDSLFKSKETLGGLAAKLGYFQFFEGDMAAEDNYLYALRHVDLEQIGEMAAKHLRLEAMNSVLLVPELRAEACPPAVSLAAEAADIWPKAHETASSQGRIGTERAGTEIIDLGGGRKLALLPDETLPYVSLRMVFTGGDALLDKKDQGLAALTAAALTRGAGDLSATGYQDFLSDRASDVSAASDRDLFVVSAKYPSRFEDDILSLFEETLNAPAFADEEVRRARDEQLADIERSEDQPLGLAFRRLFPFLFPESTYGYLHLGTKESLGGLKRGDLAGFWKRQRGQAWIMAACGDFDVEKVLALAKLLARKAAPTEPGFPKPAWTDEDELELTLPGRNQTHLLVIFPGPAMPDPDTPAIRLLQRALSGQGGILFSELREEKSLGYAVNAMLWQTRNAGFLAFYIGTSSEGAAQALDGFKDIAQRLGKAELSRDELERARNLIKGEYYREHQSLASRSREAAGLLLRGLPEDYNRETIEKARGLGAEDLKRIAAKYLDWGKAYLVRIDPE